VELQSPLGKYAPIAALAVSLLVVGTDLVLHLLVALNIASNTDPFLDELTFGAFGVILGSVTAHNDAVTTAANKINGMEQKVNELANATPGVAPMAKH